MTEQQKSFWDIIEVFDKEGLLPYVMLIGSWAELVYQHYIKTGFVLNIMTSDVDFFYPNLRRPKDIEFRISEKMRELGFVYIEHRLSGIGKFVKNVMKC